MFWVPREKGTDSSPHWPVYSDFLHFWRSQQVTETKKKKTGLCPNLICGYGKAGYMHQGSSLYPNPTLPIRFRIWSRSFIHLQGFDLCTTSHLLGLELADPDSYLNHPVKVLLGSDVHADIIIGEIIQGKPDELIFTSSQSGWLISGRTLAPSNSTMSNLIGSHHCTSHENLSDQLQEEMSMPKISHPDEEYCES